MIGERSAEARGVEHIDLDEVDVEPIQCRASVDIPGRHLRPPLHQGSHQMPAQEPTGACYEHPHTAIHMSVPT